ncbi:hypothetical protein PM082_004398 [Marasmius tenuissimus]|nr:hypothetical protein PM082_004398 [Marasmius tenuissimus]
MSLRCSSFPSVYSRVRSTFWQPSANPNHLFFSADPKINHPRFRFIPFSLIHANSLMSLKSRNALRSQEINTMLNTGVHILVNISNSSVSVRLVDKHLPVIGDPETYQVRAPKLIPFFCWAPCRKALVYRAWMYVRTRSSCLNLSNIPTPVGCFFIGIILSEVLLAVRLWVVWERRTLVAISLFIFFLGCGVPCFVLFRSFLEATKYVEPPMPHTHGCYITGGNNTLYLCWVLLMVYDTGTRLSLLCVYCTSNRCQIPRNSDNDIDSRDFSLLNL